MQYQTRKLPQPLKISSIRIKNAGNEGLELFTPEKLEHYKAWAVKN